MADNNNEWKVFVKQAPTQNGRAITTTLSPSITIGELRKRIEKVKDITKDEDFWLFLQSQDPLTESESLEPAFNVVYLMREEHEEKTLKEMGGFDYMCIYVLKRFPKPEGEVKCGPNVVNVTKGTVGLPKSLFDEGNLIEKEIKNIYKLNFSGSYTQSTFGISYAFKEPSFDENGCTFSKSVAGAAKMGLHELASHFLWLGPKEMLLRITDSLHTLKFTVEKAENLVPMDRNGFSDPFVVIKFMKDEEMNGTFTPVHEEKTEIIKKTLNPVWNHVINYRKGGKYATSPDFDHILFEIYDKDLILNDQEGKVKLDWFDAKIYNRSRFPRFSTFECPLVPFKEKEGAEKKELGTLFISLERIHQAEDGGVIPLPSLD